MAKYYNNQKKSGKVAGSVFAIRYGETIERAYNPVVSNPNTENQVASRSKLKILSQLAAVMSPVIAMPRQGAVSTRNRFISNNYNSANYSSNQASITLANIKLTTSVVSFPTIRADRAAESISVTVVNDDRVENYDFDRVVYAMFEKRSDGTLRLLATKVVTSQGSANSWEANMPLTSLAVVVYAYGIRDNNDNATVVFGNLEVPTAEMVAKLIVNRTLTESDITLTETKSASLNAVV